MRACLIKIVAFENIFLYLYKRKVMEDTVTPPVQHIGEFVLTKNGSLDFGEIPSEIARVIKRQEGKIRLRIGVEIDNAIGNYGEKHIERPERKVVKIKNRSSGNAKVSGLNR